ncbi:MAG TPA: DUF6150 family protein [Edaphocola sp.]|nr:DUF6150 family protein [Edaphocola sp.]
MKKHIFCLLICVAVSLITFSNSYAQFIYETESKSEAEVKVYVSKWKSEADLIVYKSEWKSGASGNKGIWYYTKWKSEGKKVYFTKWKSEADIVVYFSDWKSEAGWKNEKNKQLLDK